MHQDDERRQRRNRIILGVGIVLIMVLSTFGIVLDQGTQSGGVERVNGIKFEAAADGVIARINGVTTTFSFLPSQVTGIPVEGDVAGALRDTVSFYMTSDPKDYFNKDIDAVVLHLQTVLPELEEVFPVPAFTNATGYTRKNITCEDATTTVPVVLFSYGNRTALIREDGCIHALATSQADVYRLGERIMLMTLGVTDVETA